ncbi:hypothetical protein BG003_008630 [Podila horticola]|nr:hypothetical protein BG003_008630 [Podila horticola]
MVEDIRLAREAAVAGRDYYLNDSSKKDQQHQQQQQQQQTSSHGYYGLIPFSNLCAVSIHSHRYLDRDIAFLIDTIEALQRIMLKFPGPVLQTFCALGRHKSHLTEVDTRFCDIDSAQVLTLLSSCEKLEVLAASEILAQDVVKCRSPWACLGLKRLTVDIVVDTSSLLSPSSGAEMASAARAVFERLGQLVQLESLDIAGGITSYHTWQMHLRVHMGLGQLRGLKEMRHLRARGSMFAAMGAADAEWMVQHWPQLETIQMRRIDASRALPEVEWVFLQAGVLVKRE